MKLIFGEKMSIGVPHIGAKFECRLPPMSGVIQKEAVEMSPT